MLLLRVAVFDGLATCTDHEPQQWGSSSVDRILSLSNPHTTIHNTTQRNCNASISAKLRTKSTWQQDSHKYATANHIYKYHMRKQAVQRTQPKWHEPSAPMLLPTLSQSQLHPTQMQARRVLPPVTRCPWMRKERYLSAKLIELPWWETQTTGKNWMHANAFAGSKRPQNIEPELEAYVQHKHTLRQYVKASTAKFRCIVLAYRRSGRYLAAMRETGNIRQWHIAKHGWDAVSTKQTGVASTKFLSNMHKASSHVGPRRNMRNMPASLPIRFQSNMHTASAHVGPKRNMPNMPASLAIRVSIKHAQGFKHAQSLFPLGPKRDMPASLPLRKDAREGTCARHAPMWQH